MMYKDMTLLQKLDFWTSIYDIEFYFERNVTTVIVKKSDVEIERTHTELKPSELITNTILNFEKINPLAIRNHDKKCA